MGGGGGDGDSGSRDLGLRGGDLGHLAEFFQEDPARLLHLGFHVY
jgi:hypothetical protein